MTNTVHILVLLEDIVVILALSLILLYLIPVLSVRRFQHANNALILNVFWSVVVGSTFFAVYFSLGYFNVRRLYAPDWCILLFYAYSHAGITVQFAFVTFSVHRYFIIVHHTKAFFKRKRWITICIGCQWVIQCIVALPFVLRKAPVRKSQTDILPSFPPGRRR